MSEVSSEWCFFVQKIEIIDDEDEEEDNGDEVISPDVELVQSQLEFKVETPGSTLSAGSTCGSQRQQG